jgi:ATP-dependent protease HslVU (ClpYQ) ATPase subunit
VGYHGRDVDSIIKDLVRFLVGYTFDLKGKNKKVSLGTSGTAIYPNLFCNVRRLRTPSASSDRS